MTATLPRSACRAFVPYPDAAVPNAPHGPLAGLTFAVKDIFDVAGYPTGCGNPHMLALSGIKTTNAPVVDALLGAGATFVGKTYTEELAYSMIGKNAHFGTPMNGAAPDRVCGGSSSGSASAVSNELCDFALGSDTGGSVRAPASHCALIGLRPTHARLSLECCMPLAPGFDTCGWFARDIDTFARVGDVLLGDDTATLAAQPRLTLPSDLLAELDTPVTDAFAAALERVRPRFSDIAQANIMTPSIDALFSAYRHLQGYQAWRSHGATIDEYDLQLGPGVKERFAWSRSITDEQNDAAERVRVAFRDELLAQLGSTSIIAMPTMPDVAPRVSDTEDALDAYRNRSIRMVCVASLAGFPQLSLPLMQIDGVPLGFSLIGPPGSDGKFRGPLAGALRRRLRTVRRIRIELRHRHDSIRSDERTQFDFERIRDPTRINLRSTDMDRERPQILRLLLRVFDGRARPLIQRIRVSPVPLRFAHITGERIELTNQRRAVPPQRIVKRRMRARRFVAAQ
jgi:amidase